MTTIEDRIEACRTSEDPLHQITGEGINVYICSLDGSCAYKEQSGRCVKYRELPAQESQTSTRQYRKCPRH